ncbi:hypothetical protein BKA66DRAFT_489548 [Pyrenochaeta sp. MPI-SDFR-AT-0127]|nr:hypothetical protein BKA66DRAFT_489548 [Pyrenochaeta sp. MPI-SDFR-AT-0127]
MANHKEVIIIGGGISGLGMAVQLKRMLGHDHFTIYEKSDNIGGTWWHNRYPGCACDIPSHFYSYSFALKPDWSSMYPGRNELHEYFLSVAKKYDIVSHCHFNAMCKSTVWDNQRHLWICTFQDTITGDVFVREAPIVVSAVGTLDRPNVPNIKGATEFQGKIFHSARWDDSVSTKNQNIVVLGNGASATQFVPELVKEVAPQGKVTQLVKSAHWWTKRGNPTYSGLWKWSMAYIPFAARLYRVYLAWQLESVFYSFSMTSSGLRMRNEIREATRKYIKNDAPKQYQEILTPDYEPGCKRRVNTATYLACLHSPNMHLAKDRVTRIGERHIETETGVTYPADIIIYATGFTTQEWLYPIEIRGIGGREIHQIWDAAGGAEAYKGTVVSGFPNFFILYGPNAATGQHSVIFHSECQINYSCRLLKPILSGNNPADTIMVRPESQARDLAWVHSKLKHLVFNSGCQSWWMDPRTKKNTFIYPDPMFKYWLRTIFPSWSDFDIRKNGSSHKTSSGRFILAMLVGIGVTAWSLLSASDFKKPMALLQRWNKLAFLN